MTVLFLVSAAYALTHEQSQLGTVHGFTDDGALVYEIRTGTMYVDVDPENYDEGYQTWAVVQRGDAIAERWLLTHEQPEFVRDPAPPTQVEAWDAWKAGHPTRAPASSKREGPRGSRLEARNANDMARWTGDACRLLPSWNDEDDIATLGLSNAGEGLWALRTHKPRFNSFSTGYGSVLSVRWSPDGTVGAVIVQEEDSMTMRGMFLGHLHIDLVVAAPLVSVLAPSSVPSATVDAVVAALGDPGPLQRGEAKAERTDSVVYWADGFQAEAEALATRVPGGATAAKMDWKGAQHIVVAVGASANP